MLLVCYIFRKKIIPILYFFIQWITYNFFILNLNIFNYHKIENYLRNHLKGQICLVSTVGWSLLSGFVVKGWKSNFCDSSMGKMDFSLVFIKGNSESRFATFVPKLELSDYMVQLHLKTELNYTRVCWAWVVDDE